MCVCVCLCVCVCVCVCASGCVFGDNQSKYLLLLLDGKASTYGEVRREGERDVLVGECFVSVGMNVWHGPSLPKSILKHPTTPPPHPHFTKHQVTELLRTKGIDLDHNRFLILQGEVRKHDTMRWICLFVWMGGQQL